MSRPPVLTLQGWLLAVLLPALGLLIVVYALLVYGRLHDFIIVGFDGKLTAISTTTAGFIDPAEHERLMEPLPISNMTHDPADPTIWALDTSRHVLMKIRPADGMAEETGIKVPPEIDSLSNDLGAGNLLMLDDATGHFTHFSTATGKITPAWTVEPPITAIGTIMRRNGLYVAGRDLRKVDLTTGKVTRINSVPGPIRDMSYDKKRDVLWALSEQGNEIFNLDPATGALRKRIKLTFEKDPDNPDADPPPVELRTLVFERISEKLFGSSTSLMPIDPETGIVSVKGYLPGFGQEHGEVYQRYAGPMTQIMGRANLTYLYTMAVRGRDHIIYGLDGTIGKEHSTLLSTDTLREAEVDGVQRLMTEGVPYVSGIQPWPPWGVLKSSFAPILNEQGRPVSMAGADVDAGTIQFQIRRALVITFGFGAAMLLVGGLLTLAIARRLTGPLHAIRTAALRAAAGDYGHQTEIDRPRELRRLAQRFTAVSATLGREVKALRENLSVRQTARDRAGLVERLALMAPLVAEAPAGSPWAWGELGPRSAIPAGGAIRAAGRTLAWIAGHAEDPLAGQARRAEIAATAEALLLRHGSDLGTLGARLGVLFPEEIPAWALVADDGLHVCLRRPRLLWRRGRDGTLVEIPAPDFAAALPPAPGEFVILAGPEAPWADLAHADGATAASLLASWRSAAAAADTRAFALVGGGAP